MIRELIETQDRARLIARLSRNVMHTTCGCIEYRGAANNCGYRKLTFRHRGAHVQIYAHRLFYVLAYGRNIRADRVIDHMCRNRACVNPAHLQEITPRTNSRLVHSRARRA